MGRKIKIENRFWDKVNKTETCWLWTAATNNNGYGVISNRPKVILAHRYAWMLTHGEIPNGLEVMHSCHQRRCVRLEHLSLGTHRINMRDMQRKNLTCRRGHDWSKNPYIAPDGERQCRECLRIARRNFHAKYGR